MSTNREPSEPSSEAPAVGLTKRENEVMALILDGRFDKEIAAELGISIRTVEKHVERLRTKFGVRSRKDLPKANRSKPKNT